MNKEQKEQLKEEAKYSLEKFEARIKELKAKQGKGSEKAAAEMKEKLAQLQSNKTDLYHKYEQLKDATEENWEDAKSVYIAAEDSFKKTVSSITSMV
jgi:hypothetical protein